MDKTYRQKPLGGLMEKQVVNQVSVWYSYGVVLLVMFVAVAGAAIKDARLAKAAAKAAPQ
jgi:hypothetical protein